MTGQGHEGAEVFELAGGDLLCVFPIGSPGYADLRGSGGDVVKELSRVVVLREIGQAGGCVDGSEVRAVEGAGEILTHAAAERSAGVDAEEHDVHFVCGGEV